MGDENAQLTDAAKEQLKSTYPGVELNQLKAPDGSWLVVRAPDPGIFSAFMADTSNEKKDKAIAMRSYAMRCVVYPKPEVVSVLFDKYPAFPGKIAAHLNEMAGSEVDLDVKKL